MENENNEVKVVETKKKGNGLFTLFACVMTGVIVFLATNIGQKASKTVDPDTPKKNEVTSNVDSNTTSNVADTTVTDAEKTQVNEVIKLLFFNSEIKNNNIFASMNFMIEDSEKNPEIFKIATVIDGFDKKDYVTYKNTNGTFATNEKKENILSAIKNNNGTYSLSAEKVNVVYKKIFGTDITNYIDIEAGCPNWYFDSTNKVYAAFIGCDFYASNTDRIYLDSYTKDGEKIIVTVYTAGSYSEMGGPVTIYTDSVNSANKDKVKVYKQFSRNEIDNFVITEGNKTSFAKYNLTFEKNAEGNYYFKSVSKAN